MKLSSMPANGSKNISKPMIKIAFITGATAGIGEACAMKFAENNYNLIIIGRRKDRLDRLGTDLQKKFGIAVLPVVLDVRDKHMVKDFISSLPEEWKNIDILVNNAGLALGLDPFHRGEEEDWEIMIDTNIKGLLYVGRAVSQIMVERAHGHIINIGSIAGKEVYPKGNVYSATKHAVDAITKGMRQDLFRHGIRVTQVAPGAVETEFSKVRFKGDEDRAATVYQHYRPLTATDIADVVYFTASRPPHVNINDVVVMPTDQANATMFNKQEG